MRALDPEVFDAVWAGIEPLIPVRQVTHPLGCHRQRASDRACFAVMLVRLATGCSWEDAERLCGNEVSDTTVRDRRDEWIDAGVFDAIATEAIGGYDRIIGLDLSDVAVDGCLHKAPAGGEGTGPNPTDRGKLGWKWSILTDRNGIPLGLDHRRRQPQRLGAARPDPRRRRRTRVCSPRSTRCGSTAATTVASPANASPSASLPMPSSPRNANPSSPGDSGRSAAHRTALPCTSPRHRRDLQRSFARPRIYRCRRTPPRSDPSVPCAADGVAAAGCRRGSRFEGGCRTALASVTGT